MGYKRFQRERFSIFKSRRSEEKKEQFERMCRRKLDGDLKLDGDVFTLDGQEIFRAAEGTKREWQKWFQLYQELDDSPWLTGEMMARAWRSKKNWGYGSKSTWKSSSRGWSCMSARLNREKMARDRAEKGR